MTTPMLNKIRIDCLQGPGALYALPLYTSAIIMFSNFHCDYYTNLLQFVYI